MDPFSQPSSSAAAVRAIRDPENRSIEIGLACTLLFHVLAVLIAPRLPTGMLSGVPIHGVAANASDGQNFDIQLMPDLAPPAPAPDPSRYVETNPDAPENTPDKTTNFSDRNQQLAQPEAAKEIDPNDRPSVKGQDKIQNDTAIVSGDASKPEAGNPVVAAMAPALQPNEAQAGAPARAEQVPLPGIEKFTGEAPDGVGTNISDAKKPSNGAEELVEGIKGAPGTGNGTTATLEHSQQVPRVRPRLSQARNTILTNHAAGTANIGIAAIPAFKTEFGQYLAELVEVVDQQWQRILNERTVAPIPGTYASVTFTINSDGVIAKVGAVEETCGRPGALACTGAIDAGQPYRKWTPQMISLLGKEQTLRFNFYY